MELHVLKMKEMWSLGKVGEGESIENKIESKYMSFFKKVNMSFYLKKYVKKWEELWCGN
jgi:hypothetical protein